MVENSNKELFFKTYNVLLTTKSPVHIGSGDSYFPFLYNIKDSGNLDLYTESEVLDKIFELGKMDEFNKIVNSSKGSRDFYDDIRNLYKDKIQGKVLKYEVNALNNNPDIPRTAYDSDERPYIPGSSIKGSIRTAYLDSRKDKDGFIDFNDKKINSSYIEGKRLNALNNKNYFSVEMDPFKYIKVSDFVSLDFENNTEIRKEYNLLKNSVKRIKLEDKGSVLEVIPTGKRFLGTITLAFPREHFSKNDLNDAISNFYNFLFNKLTKEEYYNSKNDKVEVVCPDFSNTNEIRIQIGRHSGAEAVSFNKRSVKIKNGNGNSPSYENEARTIWVSKNRDNKYEFFSWCSLEFLKNDDVKKLKEDFTKKKNEIENSKCEERKKLKEIEEQLNRIEKEKQSIQNKKLEKYKLLRDKFLNDVLLLNIVNDIENYPNNIQKQYNTNFRKLTVEQKRLVAPFFDMIFNEKNFYDNPKFKYDNLKKQMFEDIKKYLDNK